MAFKSKIYIHSLHHLPITRWLHPPIKAHRKGLDKIILTFLVWLSEYFTEWHKTLSGANKILTAQLFQHHNYCLFSCKLRVGYLFVYWKSLNFGAQMYQKDDENFSKMYLPALFNIRKNDGTKRTWRIHNAALFHKLSLVKLRFYICTRNL